MTNKEYYGKEIIAIALQGDTIAINKETGWPVSCEETNCNECALNLIIGNSDICGQQLLPKWAEAEHIEPATNNLKNDILPPLHPAIVGTNKKLLMKQYL